VCKQHQNFADWRTQDDTGLRLLQSGEANQDVLKWRERFNTERTEKEQRGHGEKNEHSLGIIPQKARDGAEVAVSWEARWVDVGRTWSVGGLGLVRKSGSFASALKRKSGLFHRKDCWALKVAATRARERKEGGVKPPLHGGDGEGDALGEAALVPVRVGGNEIAGGVEFGDLFGR